MTTQDSNISKTVSQSRRVFSIDIIRGVIIIVMASAHGIGNYVDASWLMQAPWRVPVFGIPVILFAIFQECRGVFFIISGMVLGYRTMFGWSAQLQAGKTGLGRQMTRTTVTGLVGGFIIWPVMLMLDFLFVINTNLTEYADSTETTFSFTYNRLPRVIHAGPLSACMFQIPLVVGILALISYPCHLMATKLTAKSTQSLVLNTESWSQEGSDASPTPPEKSTNLITQHYSYAFAASFAFLSSLICLLIALVRAPIGIGLFNFLKNWGNKHGFPATNIPMNNNYYKYITWNMPGVPGSDKVPLPKPDWKAYYMVMLCTEIGGGLMGAFPFMMHFFTGAVIGFSVAAMANDKSSALKDKKRAFWTVNSSYMAALMLFVLVWTAILPPHMDKWEYDRFNMPTWLKSVGLAKADFVEAHSWHTGPYELWITSLMGTILTHVTHLCELSDAGRHIQRADDPTNGVYSTYKKGQRAPLRWIRRFSTFSATAISFDGLSAIPLMRMSRLLPSVIPYSSKGLYISWSIYLAYAWFVVFMAVILLLDLVFRGYLSVDYAIVLAKSLATALVTSVIAVSKLASPKVRQDVPAWRAALVTDLTRIYNSASRSITSQHVGVQFVECFREDERLPGKTALSEDSHEVL